MPKRQEVDINIRIDFANVQPASHKSSSQHNSAKIRVSVSVADLAYSARVLCGIGVIQTKNVSEILRLYSECLSTPNAKDISFDSLRTKYYNPETSTKQNVKEVVIKQLNYILQDIKKK